MGFNKDDRRLVSLMLTKDQLAAIGSVVVESTFCQELVESVIWGATKLKEDQGKYFTGPLQMNSLLELMGSVAKPKLRSNKKRAALTSLISRMKEANNERNIIVHGSWQPDGVGVIKVMQDGADKHPPAVVVKHRLNSPPLVSSAVHNEKTAIKIAALSWELMGVLDIEIREPSPKKSSLEPPARSRNPVRTQPKVRAPKRQPKASHP
jgi:hypothetical protein